MSEGVRAAFAAVVETTSDALSKKKILGVAGLPTLGNQYGVGDVPAWIPSGTIVDALLGGGLALGRVSEVYSIEQSEGKTTLLIHFAISVQRAGGVVVWIESEAAIDKGRAARMGLDLSLVVFWAPDTIEHGFEYVGNILNNLRTKSELAAVPVLVVWDTIAAAEAAAAKEGDAYGEGMANRPRIVSEALRDLVADFWGHRVHFCLINQSITKIEKGGGPKKGGWSGPQYEQPCGKAIKFYASYRIELAKKATIPGENPWQSDGVEVSITVKKNKLAPFPRRATLRIGADGIDVVGSYLATFENFSSVWKDGVKHATGLDVWTTSGSWYVTKSIAESGDVQEVKAQGWAGLEAAARSDPGIMRYFHARAYELWPLPADRQFEADGWCRPLKAAPAPQVVAPATKPERQTGKRAKANAAKKKSRKKAS